MKHEYTDTQLQAAIDEACNEVAQSAIGFLNTLDLDPQSEVWAEETPARLDLIKAALAALPEPEPPTVDGKTPGQFYADSLSNSEPDEYYTWEEMTPEMQTELEARLAAVLAAFGNQSQPTEIPWIEWHGGECPLKDDEVKEWEYKLRDGFTICHPEKPRLYAWSHNKSSNDIIAYRVLKWKAECAPPQLRPLAEAGEVPEGCVRYYTYKKDGEWTTKSKYRAMQDTHYIDTRLPEPEPLVTKPISLPEWTPQVGDVVTLKSGGAKMTVVKLADTEGGLLAFLCEWFSDSGEYDSGVIYLTSLQPA